MKNSIFALIAISVLFVMCSKDGDISPQSNTYSIDLDTVTLSKSMKGWELYSWYDSEWRFSLLPGTNVNKTFKGITTNSYIVTGTEQLKELLAKLPENETVVMCCQNMSGHIDNGTFVELELPPLGILAYLQEYAHEISIILFIEMNMYM